MLIEKTGKNDTGAKQGHGMASALSDLKGIFQVKDLQVEFSPDRTRSSVSLALSGSLQGIDIQRGVVEPQRRILVLAQKKAFAPAKSSARVRLLSRRGLQMLRNRGVSFFDGTPFWWF